MSRGILELIKIKLDQKRTSSLNFLKGLEPVNLDPVFPDSKKRYTFEMSKELSLHMKSNGIAFAKITTASNTGPSKKALVDFSAIAVDLPPDIFSKGHPDLLQRLYDKVYVVRA